MTADCLPETPTFQSSSIPVSRPLLGLELSIVPSVPHVKRFPRSHPAGCLVTRCPTETLLTVVLSAVRTSSQLELGTHRKLTLRA